MSAGWLGVDLFFALSGFLIAGIIYDAKGKKHFFRNFYMRRTLRIFPLYYAYLVAFVVVLGVAQQFHGPSAVLARALHESIWAFAYLTNVEIALKGTSINAGLNHFWSLAVEEQYYLMWPLVVFFLNRNQLQRVCFGLIAGAVLHGGCCQ